MTRTATQPIAFAAAAGLRLLTAGAALAHPGHAGHEALGVGTGLLHPLTGADHMLAMVAVGLWAALRGGRSLVTWPATFVTAMLVGFGLGGALWRAAGDRTGGAGDGDRAGRADGGQRANAGGVRAWR